LHIVIAQTNPDLGYKGITAFIVEASWEGVSIGVKEDKLGIRSSDTHSIMYTDVKIPKKNVLGEVGQGFKMVMKILEGGRIGIAAQALGIAQGAYDRAAAYARERKTFGKAIIEHQAIGHKLANMATEIEAARMLVYRAAYLKDQGEDYGLASSMAKLYAAETAMRHTVSEIQRLVINRSIQKGITELPI